MSAKAKPDTELKDLESSEKEDEEQKEERNDENVEKVERTNDEVDAVEVQENIYTSDIQERIKSIKSDLGLVIVNGNEKKLNESGKTIVDKDKKRIDGNEEDENVPPALPPRPPPRPRQPCTCTCELNEREIQERNEIRIPRSCWANGLRKYVFLCTACGSLSILLGALFLIVYFMLKTYTSSLNHFETIPTYVPSGMLIATGFLIVCLACRKNRNSFLMKLCGLCSFCCAVLCVSVTITTAVIHMNRLQTLRECLYTLKTQSCTCYSVLMDNDRISDEGIKFVFNSTPDCEVIHGALYSCLRAIFGLSVLGILICIFSCMLVYQLLSHEKKKMYWAQLEMRCRYLYRQQRNSHYYSCCDECRYPPHPHELFPWDLMGNRFWSAGRMGNLYTPNPEDRGNHNRLRSGWNWRRLPWSRSGTSSNEPTRANLGSPDSQYGFSSTPTVDGTLYTVLDPRTSVGINNCHPGIPSSADITEGSFYSWGPPPPYASNRNSANNSPARRSLGDILHQVSPIRRNDNVSPARGLHHVHRHHMHHNRQCSSSSRQIPNSAQNPLDSLQKATPFRATPITNVIQQQQAGLDPLWSNSLSSVHRFQKVIQNKTNYENMYDLDNILPTSGFNTLPSLKKRNQPRASDIFQDETSTAYFFSSAENLSCSTSNIKMPGQNENLPPRVFLSSQPNTSRYGPDQLNQMNQMNQNFSFKSQNELKASESSNQSGNLEKDFITPGNKPLQSTDRNTSIVGKLFVNCSPSKQKSRNAQTYCFGREENVIQNPRKKISKKLEPKDVEAETSNESVITFHYRVGIPRSPDVQNFNQFSDKSLFHKTEQVECTNELLLKDKSYDADMSQVENQKTPKNTKYIIQDLELLEKHGSLIQEFSRNLDLKKKYRNIRFDDMRSNGIVSENLIQTSDSRKLPQNFSKNSNADLRRSPGVSHVGSENRPSFQSSQTNESVANEEYLLGNLKASENESDVYFGDISNSSCYMSLQNDGLDSLMYEDAVKEKVNLPSFSNTGHPVLNKQNLKMMENESLDCNDTIQRYDGNLENKQNSQSSPYSRHQKTREDVKQQGIVKKTSRRSLNNNSHFNGSFEKVTYFGHGVHDHYRQPDHQESITSIDEQSSGSFTADSGISTGRNFMPASFDNTYHEIGLKSEETNRSISERPDTLNKKLPVYGSKISHLNFSHPLFQKPKALPRGNRYRDSESRQKNKFDADETESVNYGESDRQNKNKRNFSPKAKTTDVTEEVANQLLNTCNLTLTQDSDHFLEDDHFDSLCRTQDVQLPIHEENFQSTLRKSPKPLPRTSASNKSSENNSDHTFGKTSKYLKDTDKMGNFIAPDAQYEFQEKFKGDSKPKTLNKSQNLTKSKPAVPARPVNLQMDDKNGGKMENFSDRMLRSANELNCSVPRRRQNVLENSGAKTNIEIGPHSVNV